MTELQLRLWCLWMCHEYADMDHWTDCLFAANEYAEIPMRCAVTALGGMYATGALEGWELSERMPWNAEDN